MTDYNLTLMQSSTNIADFVCNMNYELDYWIAIGILILILVATIFILISFGYTIYTAFPVGMFISSVIALLLRLWQCNGVGMVSTNWVIVLFVLTGIAAFIRVMVTESQ